MNSAVILSQFVDFDGFAFTTQRFNHHPVKAFTRARAVAEEGFAIAIT